MVIAIIGILAELLLPTLGKVRVTCEVGSLHEQLEAGSVGDEHVRVRQRRLPASASAFFLCAGPRKIGG